MIFQSPVKGTIHPTGWVRPSGNHDPHLVRGFIRGVHDGIDISFSRVGDPILAAAPGKVYFVGHDPQGSLYVCIDHGSRRTLYGHLNDETVKEGQNVAVGALIGHCGYSGRTVPEGPPGAHLHWEVFDAATKRYNGWLLLAQNQPVVRTVHPKPWDGNDINIRATQGQGTTLGPKYAVANQAGHIVRVSDGADQGLTATPRPYGGRVTGASYPAGQGYAAGNTWERIELAGAYRYLATPLAIVT